MALIHVPTGMVVLAPLADFLNLPDTMPAWSVLAAMGFIHTGPMVSIWVDRLAFGHLLQPRQIAGMMLILAAVAGMIGGPGPHGRMCRSASALEVLNVRLPSPSRDPVPISAGLELHTGYFADRAASRALTGLLRDIFDVDIGLLDRLGGQDPSAMPFGYFDSTGVCVANFSTFSMPLVINGRPVRSAGYQSGAVRPHYRGQGLYRDLMQRAFDWTDAQGFELGILLTDKPELYLPYGFCVVEQHFLTGPMPAKIAATPARNLSIENDADVALLQAILRQRQPVSDRFAVVSQAEMFLLNPCFDPSIRLSHLPDHNAVVAWRGADETFHLLDIAAANLPPLDAVVSAISAKTSNMAVYFPADRLGWSGTPEVYHGACALMVRGDARAHLGPEPLMLSPMADF